MYIFSCEPEWGAMLTCIYVAWTSKYGAENIKLMLEPIEQYSLFDEYIHVDSDWNKAEKVMDAVNMKISPYVYSQLAYTSMAYEDDILDVIYRVMILGFAYGPGVLDMVKYRDVMRFRQINKRVGMEACHMKEFLRFHQLGNTYVAHLEPKSRVIIALAEDFLDRMPSENWIIVDDTHREAAVHLKDENYYIKKLSSQELDRLILSENENDDYTDMWKAFFNSIAIKERSNAKCQLNHFPMWTRKHVVEL